MRKRSRRIQPLHQLALNKEQLAARELGNALTGLNQCRAQLEQLYSYREEYRKQFNQQASYGVSGERLHQYQAFMKQLDQAIQEQHRQLAQQEKLCQQTKQQWQDKRVRSKVLGNVMDRFVSEEQHHEAKTEQRETDDINNRRK